MFGLTIFFAILFLVNSESTFSIIHYNDMHSRLAPADNNQVETCELDDELCYGGYARLATVLANARAKGPTLFMDAGDQFTGTMFNHFYRGSEIVRFQELLKTDVMTLGNHEFDFGPNVTASYLQNLSFPVASCNVSPLPGSVLDGVIKLGPVVLNLTLNNGSSIKVGIVGWTTTSCPCHGVQFLPLVPSVTECVNQLQAEGVNIIIGLGHAGLQSDGDTLVAANVQGLDLVVGAHSHTFLYNGTGPILDVSNVSVRDVPDFPNFTYPYPIQAAYDPLVSIPYVQSFFASKYVGNLSVTFDDGGHLIAVEGAPILLGGLKSSNPVESDPLVKSLVDEYAAPMRNLLQSVVGISLVHLDGRRNIVRLVESNLGNLIADSLVWEVQRNRLLRDKFGPSFVAVVNGGGIRAAIDNGPITVNQVFTVLPFGNVLSIKRISGASLMKTLSHSADQRQQIGPVGGFLQVSGLQYTMDISLPKGHRLLEANIMDPSSNCLSPILPEEYYSLVTSEMTAKGGDGFSDLADAETIYPSGRILTDVLIEYIETFSPIAPAVQGRVRILDGTDKFVPSRYCPLGSICNLTRTTYSCESPRLEFSVPSCNGYWAQTEGFSQQIGHEAHAFAD